MSKEIPVTRIWKWMNLFVTVSFSMNSKNMSANQSNTWHHCKEKWIYPFKNIARKDGWPLAKPLFNDNWAEKTSSRRIVRSWVCWTMHPLTRILKYKNQYYWGNHTGKGMQTGLILGILHWFNAHERFKSHTLALPYGASSVSFQLKRTRFVISFIDSMSSDANNSQTESLDFIREIVKED